MAVKTVAGAMLRRGAVLVAVVGLILALRSSLQHFDITRIVHPAYLLAGVGLFFIHYTLQIIGWHLILRALGETPTFQQSCRMWTSSLMARWIPGPFVYSIARLMLAKDFGMHPGVVAYGIVLEMALIVVGAVATTLMFLGGLTTSVGAKVLQLAGPAAAIFVAASVLVSFRPSVMRLLVRSKPFGWVSRRILKRDLSLPDIKPLAALSVVGLLAFYVCFWSFSGLILCAIAASYGNLQPRQATTCISSFAGSWFIGFLSVLTPAGLGVRELAMYILMGGVFPKPLIVVFGLLMRLEMLVVEASLVAAVSTYYRFKPLVVKKGAGDVVSG